MTVNDLRALLDAASAATPGPWNIEHGRYLVAQDCYSFHSNGVLRNNFGISSVSKSNVVCTLPGNQYERLPQPEANITYIAAASPDVVAALARIAVAAAQVCQWDEPEDHMRLAEALRDAGLLTTAPQETK